MTIASLIYHAAAVLSMAAVAGWLLVRACNAWTRPDNALAGLMRLSHELHHFAESGRVFLATRRWLRAENQRALEAAVKPLDWRGM